MDWIEAVISKGKTSRSVEIKFLSCGQSQRFVTASLSELGLESWRITWNPTASLSMFSHCWTLHWFLPPEMLDWTIVIHLTPPPRPKCVKWLLISALASAELFMLLNWNLLLLQSNYWCNCFLETDSNQHYFISAWICCC